MKILFKFLMNKLPKLYYSYTNCQTVFITNNFDNSFNKLF